MNHQARPQKGQIANTQIQETHKTVGTVGTVGTANNHAAFSRSHRIKEVGTGGNTNTLLNIRARRLYAFWLSLFPPFSRWEQIGNSFHLWKPRSRALFPLFPLFPPFLKLEEHVYVCFPGGGAV